MTDQPEKELSETMLYVSNLPFSIGDEQLLELFAAYNPTTAYVARRKSGSSKGFGFVNFGSNSEQQAALAAMDGKEVEERELTVSVAHKDERRNERGELQDQTDSETVIYVSNLPFSFGDEELQELFAEFAPVGARVARRAGNGRSKGFGFVEFADADAQQAALAKDGTTVDERDLVVKVSYGVNSIADMPEGTDKRRRRRRRRKGRRGGDDEDGAAAERRREDDEDEGPPEPEGPSQTNVYVSNLPFSTDEADLTAVFDGLDVVAASIARTRDGGSKGFGFVQFSSPEEQTKALEKNGALLEDREIIVQVAQREGLGPRKRNRRRRKPAGGQGGGGGGGGGGGRRRRATVPSTTQVYVSNLPFSLEDDGLRDIFAEYDVSEAHVARRPSGRSKGFGFVTFASQDQQQAAMEAFRGFVYEERELAVEAARTPVDDDEAEPAQEDDGAGDQ